MEEKARYTAGAVEAHKLLLAALIGGLTDAQRRLLASTIEPIADNPVALANADDKVFHAGYQNEMKQFLAALKR